MRLLLLLMAAVLCATCAPVSGGNRPQKDPVSCVFNGPCTGR
jgi:hypothetical protein